MKLETWNEKYGAQDNAKLQEFLDSPRNSIAILQLKHVEENVYDIFMDYSWLREHGREPKLERYSVVYVGDYQAGTTLDGIYTEFNIRKPENFQGHSLSVSDVVAIKRDGAIQCHYVKSIGFQELPNSFLEKPKLIDKQQESPFPIARIDYLGTDGKVYEQMEYTSEGAFRKDVEENAFYGVPMTVKLYMDGDNRTVPHDYLYDLGMSIRGVEKIPNPHFCVPRFPKSFFPQQNTPVVKEKHSRKYHRR